MEFNNRINNDSITLNMLSTEGNMTGEDMERLKRIRRAWNFYDGYHWEEIAMTDKPQITENYCRAFVNKFVSFEFGKGFTTKYSNVMNDIPVNDKDETILEFVNRVWDYNKFEEFCIEVGQSKAITGDAWVQAKYYDKEDLDDPYGEHPDGMIKVMTIPTSVVFPEYDVHDKSSLKKVTVMYPIEVEANSFLTKTRLRKVVYKQVWTKDRVEIYEGKELIADVPNKYGVIPFVQIKNFPVVGKTEGLSDLEDIIPLNVEMNMKKSDISEIIDYHSAPVTVVFGARIASLEKGANKIWGGLPKDSRVQNLELNSDLGASVNYVHGLKTAMHEIGGVPEGALGGTQPISNTSGVALQFINMPLIERTRIKRLSSKAGLEQVTKLILLIAEKEKLVTIPKKSKTTLEFPVGEEITRYDFFWNEVTMPDTLPKDELLELQQIQTEMTLGIESKRGAMERTGKDNIDFKLRQIEEERVEKEDQAMQAMLKVKREQAIEDEEDTKLNSGFLNGDTPIEQVRKENQGANMPQGDM